MIVWISPKTLCSPVLASFADSKLLDPGQLTLRINRTLGVSHYIWHSYRPNNYTHVRGLRRWGQGMYGYSSYYIECSYSEACVIIIELAIFRGLSGDDVSMSVKKSNYASSQAVSKVLVQLQIITVYHYL